MIYATDWNMKGSLKPPKLMLTEDGQALVEALIAISVAIVVVSALISLSIFSLRNSKESSYTAQATSIAQTQLEYARAYRDHSSVAWSGFVALGQDSTACLFAPTISSVASGNRCYFGLPLTSVGPPQLNRPAGSSAPFQYIIGFSCVAGTCNQTGGTVRASVVVEWTVSGKSYSVYNFTDFTNWRGK
ncbi:MAG: hypothetical protein AAB443_04575 [Patescibacteria group bacterium]